MALEFRIDAERHVRAGADFENRTEIGQPSHQVRVLDGAHAMADPGRSHEVERIADAFGSADFAGMHGQAEAGIAGDVEGPGIVQNAPHPLVRSEEHTSELQSLMRISYAVFCLKKQNTTNYTKHSINITQT